MQIVADQFPLYSKADEALWQVADSYHRMGDRFENQQVIAYQRIVKDYPLSIHAEDARAQLEVMKRPIPEVDPVRYAQQKYELENRTKPGKLAPALGMFSGKPDVSQAAKGGNPQMEGLRPTIPASVPPAAARPELGTNDVTISQPGAANAALDSGTEVRAPAATPAPATPEATPVNATSVPKPAVPGAITPETTATQQTMTAAQQKKAYAEQVKKMQQAQKVAAKDRKKKEAEQADLVKAAKKKNREKQDQKAPDAKQQPDADTKKQ
jgi:hypothetical protein